MTTLLIERLESLAASAWMPVFRAELLLLLLCAAFLWPQARESLKNSGKSALWIFAVAASLYCALIFARTGGYFFTFEDWEELHLGRLVFEGRTELFQSGVRHGTTYPFLLAHLYAVFGPATEISVFLNMALLLCVPVLIFLAAGAAFTDKRRAVYSALLFCAWPGLAEFAVLAQGKTGLILAQTAAFVLAVSLSLAKPRPASFGLLFIITDLAAKTRQELGLLYPAAFAVWFLAEKEKKKNWWVLLPALCAAALYFPLLARGVDCHINPIRPIAGISAEGNRDLLFTAAIFVFALARSFRGAAGAEKRFLAAVVAVFSLISTVYLANPGGPQARLFIQTAPFLCVAAAPAFSRPAFLFPALLAAAGLWSWSGNIPRREADTAAALAGLAAVKGSYKDTLLFPGLDALSEWKFRSSRPGPEISLDGAARLIDISGSGAGGVSAGAGYSFLSGRAVWLVSRDRNGFGATHYSRLSAAGRKECEIQRGGWRMEKFRFPGKAADPAASKSASDLAVKKLLSGELKDGEALLIKALESDPRNTNAILSLGALRAREGRLRECAALVEKARNMTPPEWRAAISEKSVCGRSAAVAR
ncbi:MAG: hypothetical protein HY796_00645 [Elusimicrobia bacterium]|nr:hypothetical protein [Elusimicrobiota bacterium]